MESVLGRYRNLTILVGVLFLQVLGLAVQVKRTADAENTRLIRVWAVDLITPFERGLVWAQSGSRDLWHSYFFLRGVRAENRQLKDQIEKMRLDQVRLNEDAIQAHRLQSLLAFKEQFIEKTVAAQVIGSSGSDLSRSIYIDKGSNDGIAQDMAVITAGGIVGKVLRVYPATSLVLMINDQSSGVGVLLEKSRLQGVLRGTPNGEVILERVMSDEQVAPGEIVLSSGGDQIFPKGLPVGTVSAVSPGREMFLSIKVKPAADLSRLEEVLVVTEKQERAPAVAESGRVRAADILAQRLPSVPDKPPGVAGSAKPASGSNGEAGVAPSAGAKVQPNAMSNPASGQIPKTDASRVQVLKTVGQKVTSGDSATNATADGSALSGATKPTSVVAKKPPANASSTNAPTDTPKAAADSSSDTSATVTPKSAVPSPKPATTKPKAASAPPDAQPAADDPH
jgi:rod shape-determining protein MreC